ncbi:MAG: type VI secretion system-associated protein TagF [Burkholderiales bacterium]|jgi:type VI secretion system protein ImpM|nr:type VI secretion system-associated protein TagF [Burkholderiales bacterium]
MNKPAQVNIAYFGKLRTRDDFVRNNVHNHLISGLDDWIAHALEIIRKDSHWQMPYDALSPLRFIILGSRRKLSVGGYLAASRDSSGRRFPFLCAAPLESASPTEFALHAPLVFRPVWNAVVASVTELMQSSDPSQILHRMNTFSAEVYTSAASTFSDFLDKYTIENIVERLTSAGHVFDWHNTVIALGELLKPLMQSGKSYSERGLLLPLPEKDTEQLLIATWWLNLIVPFTLNTDFEITFFISSIAGKPRLAIGFLGANSKELACLMSSPAVIEDQFLSLDNAAWVDQVIAGNAEKNKLSSYLRQPQLSLRTLRDTFLEVFVGA